MAQRNVARIEVVGYDLLVDFILLQIQWNQSHWSITTRYNFYLSSIAIFFVYCLLRSIIIWVYSNFSWRWMISF